MLPRKRTVVVEVCEETYSKNNNFYKWIVFKPTLSHLYVYIYASYLEDWFIDHFFYACKLHEKQLYIVVCLLVFEIDVITPLTRLINKSSNQHFKFDFFLFLYIHI